MGITVTLNIYYYLYECLKLASFPRLSQLAKFSCNKSCGGVTGRESERTQLDDNFFLFFFVLSFLFLFFCFFLCWIWPDGPVIPTGDLLGGRGGIDGIEACKTVQRRRRMCEDTPSRFISKQKKILFKNSFQKHAWKRKALQEYFFEKCIFY